MENIGMAEAGRHGRGGGVYGPRAETLANADQFIHYAAPGLQHCMLTGGWEELSGDQRQPSQPCTQGQPLRTPPVLIPG